MQVVLPSKREGGYSTRCVTPNMEDGVIRKLNVQKKKAADLIDIFFTGKWLTEHHHQHYRW